MCPRSGKRVSVLLSRGSHRNNEFTYINTTAAQVMQMRFLIPALLCLLFHAVGHALDADYSSLPDKQRAILDKTSFELRILPPTALFPSGDAPKDLSADGFLLFVCSARQNLGERLLWITAKVEFSNGYTREFSSVGFHLIAGSSAAIHKLDFPATPALEIKSLKITSAVVQ